MSFYGYDFLSVIGDCPVITRAYSHIAYHDKNTKRFLFFFYPFDHEYYNVKNIHLKRRTLARGIEGGREISAGTFAQLLCSATKNVTNAICCFCTHHFSCKHLLKPDAKNSNKCTGQISNESKCDEDR